MATESVLPEDNEPEKETTVLKSTVRVCLAVGTAGLAFGLVTGLIIRAARSVAEA